MPRVDKGGSATAPRGSVLPHNGEAEGEAEPQASAKPEQVPATKPSARPTARSTTSMPVDPELAAFRSRLEKQLAARRSPARDVATPTNPGRMSALAPVMAPLRFPSTLWERPGWLTIAPFVACLVAAAIVWWLHRDVTAPAASVVQISQTHGEPPALDQAQPKEHDKVEQLSHELAAVWRQLTAQTMALADKAAQERELEDLRQTLQQTHELSAAYEHLLGEERKRAQVLEEQLAAYSEPTAALQISALQKSLQQAEERSADLEKSVARERDRSRLLEGEIAALRNALRDAEEHAAGLERALTEERDRNRSIEQQIASHAETAGAAMADKAAREQEIAALLEGLKQAREQAAGQEQLLADERGRIRLLEAEIAARRQSIVVTAPSALPAALPAPATGGATGLAGIGTPSSSKAVLLAGPPPTAVKAASDAASDDTDLPRLMTRARMLLSQGDVGAARIVLERAAEGGNALALFALAETFDPAMLSGWGTMGTQGDVMRARELYAKAFAEGVLEAKERLAAMR